MCASPLLSQVYLVRTNIQRCYYEAKNRVGQPFQLLKRIQGEHCGKARTTINNDYAAVKSTIVDNFSATVAADLEELKEFWRTTNNVVEITVK